MSDTVDYNGVAAQQAAAQVASGLVQTTGNLTASTFNMKNTKKLAKYQNEMAVENWNRANEYSEKLSLNQYNNQMQAARNAGLNPLAALSGGSHFMQQVGSIPQPSVQQAPMQPADFSGLGSVLTDAIGIAKASMEKDKIQQEKDLLVRRNLHEQTTDDVITAMKQMVNGEDGVNKPFQYYNMGHIMAENLVNENSALKDKYDVDKLGYKLQGAVYNLQLKDENVLESLANKIVSEVNLLNANYNNALKSGTKTDVEIEKLKQDMENDASKMMWKYIEKLFSDEEFTLEDYAKLLATLMVGQFK